MESNKPLGSIWKWAFSITIVCLIIVGIDVAVTPGNVSPITSPQLSYGDVVTYNTKTGIIIGVDLSPDQQDWTYEIMFQSGCKLTTSNIKEIKFSSSFPWSIANENNVELDLNKLDLRMFEKLGIPNIIGPST